MLVQQNGSNTGDVTAGAVGSSPNNNGVTMNGQVIELEPASSSKPGVLTAGTQSISGWKTFTGGLVLAQGSPAPADGATFTPNGSAGNQYVVLADTGTASMTIGAPSFMSAGGFLWVILKNGSGGALTTTWNAAFKMASWVDPANGKYRAIGFVSDGTNCFEVYRTAADITF